MSNIFNKQIHILVHKQIHILIMALGLFFLASCQEKDPLPTPGPDQPSDTTSVKPPVDTTVVTPPIDPVDPEDPENPEDPQTGVGPKTPESGYPSSAFPYEVSLIGSQADFTTVNTKLPSSLSAIWTSSSYGMIANAYDSITSSRYESESWLVSPYVDLSQAKDAILAFEHTYRYGDSAINDLTLYARSKGGQWKQIAIPNYPTGADWNFVASGDIDLKDYLGKPFQFAFRYQSSDGAAAKWEIRNVSVKPVSGGSTDPTDPSDPSDPGETGGQTEAGAWLELPAATTAYPNSFQGVQYCAGKRNYSYLYDKDTYISYWVAYPLYKSTTGGSRDDAWENSWDPNLDQKYQVPTWDGGYWADYSGSISGLQSDYYARGHQIPSGDRNNDNDMEAQTYYATNMTPQLQNSFNGAVWMYLESSVRSMCPSKDTLYVVTGAFFRKVGGDEEITYITHCKDSQKRQLPVPNYYYKVLMKVKRSGANITAASTIGFWMEHFKVYENPQTDWNDYVVSVDEIEKFTGFDFFANISESIQVEAEKNTSLTTFKNF